MYRMSSLQKSLVRFVAVLAISISVPALISSAGVRDNQLFAQPGCGGCSLGGCTCNSAEGMFIGKECIGTNCTSCCLGASESCLFLNNHWSSNTSCEG